MTKIKGVYGAAKAAPLQNNQGQNNPAQNNPAQNNLQETFSAGSETETFRLGCTGDTDSYRVIFSEADLLPGLILDKYNDVLSLQALTQAFDRDDLRQVVLEALAEHFPDASVIERVDPHICELEQLPARASQLVRGERSSTIFTVNGVRFISTGWADRRPAPSSISGRTTPRPPAYAHGEALDCFTYQGGFALHLARVCDKRDRGGLFAPGVGGGRAERAA